MATATHRPPIGDHHPSANGGPTNNGGPSIGALVNRATAQFSALARNEVTLAKTELLSKAKRAGVGSALLAVSALLGLFGLALLFFTAVAALDRVWPLWLAALVVGLATLFLALLLAGAGIGRLRRSAPVPSEARSGIAADLATVRSAVRDGRHHS